MQREFLCITEKFSTRFQAPENAVFQSIPRQCGTPLISCQGVVVHQEMTTPKKPAE